MPAADPRAGLYALIEPPEPSYPIHVWRPIDFLFANLHHAGVAMFMAWSEAEVPYAGR